MLPSVPPIVLFALGLIAAAVNHMSGYRPAWARWMAVIGFTAAGCLGLIERPYLGILAEAVGFVGILTAVVAVLRRRRQEAAGRPDA